MNGYVQQRTVRIAALLALAIGWRAPAAGAGLQLTAGGRPRATIVLAERPTGSAQLAACELQHYVRKISGAELPIVREPQAVAGTRILVGESEGARALGYGNDGLKPGAQEYFIKSLPDALLLLGHDTPHFPQQVLYHGDRYSSYRSIYNEVCYPGGAYGAIGTCYAVHDFLENALGVRWYYPNDEIGEVVEPSGTIEVGSLDVRRRPDAPIRPIHPHLANTERLYLADPDNPREFQSSWVDARTSLLYWIRNRCLGGQAYNASHSFHGYDKAFGESHPEWFSTKSYERMRQLDFQNQVNPCLTAPGLFEQVLQTARDYLDGRPEPFPWAYYPHRGRFVTVGLNDNTNMCGCDDCRAQYRGEYGPAGSASHYVWGFVNRLAREIGRSHPHAGVCCLAYFNYTTPPEGMVFEPNVAVTFCKFYTGYHDRNYQERDYRQISDYVVKNRARFFTTWEYFCKPFISDWPFPCMVPHVQADDVRRLARIGGFRGGNLEFAYATSYSDASPGAHAWTSPVLDFMNLYWRVKLYDNFDFDIEARLAEYHARFFGAGGPGMQKFYTAMEDRWMSLGGGQESRSWWGKLGTSAFLEELAGYLGEAAQATEAGTVYRRRVELIDAGIMHYLRRARERYEGSAMAEFAPVGTAAVARATIPAAGDWTDDATWVDAPDHAIAKTIDNEPETHKTVFRLAYDDKHLYIRARMSEPLVSMMKATIREDDMGGFSDDSVELFFDPDGRGGTFYQFCINSLGAVYDALVDPYAIGATDTVTWDSGTMVKAATGETWWELRVAVPLGAFGRERPKAGSTWRFNVGRNRRAEPGKPPFSAWSATFGGFRKPDRFGVITFNAPEQRGRVLWNCDFNSRTFAVASGECPLIGYDGWYEDPSYAGRGWDKSWKVIQQSGNRLAVCDVNITNPSTVVPMHAVEVSPGLIAVEVEYRRLGLGGNQPLLYVADSEGRHLAYLYISGSRADEAGYYVRGGDTRRVRHEGHGLGDFAAPGVWFGMKVEIDTVARRSNKYIRIAGGDWVRLNGEPLPYYLSDAAAPPHLFIGLGTRRLNPQPLAANILELDNVRVTQLTLASATAPRADRAGGPRRSRLDGHVRGIPGPPRR